MDKEKIIDYEYGDFSFFNYNSIINFLQNNYIQIGMLILVFIIIYIVDHISNINAILYGIPSAVPGLQNQNNIKSKEKTMKQSKKTKK